MNKTNDQLLTIKVSNSKPIVIKQFDTPLQIAHRFCNDNNIELKYCKSISQSIISLMKTYINEFQFLQQFSKYFGDQVLFQKKEEYHINEIFKHDKENQYPIKELNKLLCKSQAEKLEDMSRKLYQNILSPSPDCNKMLQYSQTTKNTSAKQFINYKQNEKSKIMERSKSKSFTKSPLQNIKTNSSQKVKTKNSQIIYNNVCIQQNSQNIKNERRTLSIGKFQSNNNEQQNLSDKIFDLLDNDCDGWISGAQIDISKISDDVLNFLISVLLDIDRQRMRVNKVQFNKLFEQHYEKLDPLQKQRFLSLN